MKFAKSSFFACPQEDRTHSVGLGPTGMKPLRPLGGLFYSRAGDPSTDLEGRSSWYVVEGACWVSGALRPGPASGLSDSSVVSVSDSHRSSKSIEIFECAFMHYHFRATDQVLTHSTIRGRGTRCTVTESAHGRRHAPDASQRIRALTAA